MGQRRDMKDCFVKIDFSWVQAIIKQVNLSKKICQSERGLCAEAKQNESHRDKP